MLVNRIPDFERHFQSEANSRFNFEPFSIPVGNDDPLNLEGFLCRRVNVPRKYFEPEKHSKKRIYLHFTAGNLQGDIPTLTGDRGRVSTAFVLARDGNLFQLFSSAHWAFHLGPGCLGPFSVDNFSNGHTEEEASRNGNKNNRFLCERSVAIEISNYGPLVRDGEMLFTPRWDSGLGRFVPNSLYCTLQDEQHYHKLDEPYRGNTYYASYTDAQYEKLIILLRYLTNFYEIPRKFLPLQRRYEASADNAQFEGIVSHVNARKDKSDIGPAFDWERVIQGVQAEVFQPSVGIPLPSMVARGVGRDDTMKSEEAIEKAITVPLSSTEADLEIENVEEPGLVNVFAD